MIKPKKHIKNKTATWAKDKFGDQIAPNGKPVWENFVTWFGRSKVVDADGKPMVLYHATDAESIDAFEASKMGTYGAGIYFGDRVENTQGVFGDNIVSVYASLQNPWIIKADPDSAGAYAEDVDHPSVEAVLTLPNGRELIDQLKRDEEFLFGPDLQEAVAALGHDGIIATWPDGFQEVVVFRPEQIKSATANSGIFDPNSTSIDDTSLHGSDPSNKNLVADNQGNFELSSLDLSALEFDQVLERTHSDHQNRLTLKGR